MTMISSIYVRMSLKANFSDITKAVNKNKKDYLKLVCKIRKVIGTTW